MATTAASDDSDIRGYFESQRKAWSPVFQEALYETIIRVPLRSQSCTSTPYPVTNLIKDTEPFPSDAWLEIARMDKVFVLNPRTDASLATSSKLTLLRDVFWPWLRTCVDKKKDKSTSTDDDALWGEHEFLGMLNWYRLFFAMPMQDRITPSRLPSDGVWRLMVLSSPWGKCEHFDDLLFEGVESTPDSVKERDYFVFSMQRLARCRRQAFRKARDPATPGLEEEAFRRLVRIARCGDFGNNIDPWVMYIKHWGPVPYMGTVDRLLALRAEWTRHR